MATYSSNVTIKVSSNVYVNVLQPLPTPQSGTVYTVPANAYAILRIGWRPAVPAGGAVLTINGESVTSGVSSTGMGGILASTVTEFYAGPGTTIGFTSTVSAYIYVFGVEFINS